MDKIKQLLAGKGENYILPFFWQHGEDEATLREYMGVIQDSGIGAVCVECRPHPDFCGPKWWVDFDIIMDEARKRGMKVWLLDDAHFPTGYANGAFKAAAPELCKQYLNYNHADAAGPTPQVTFKIAAKAAPSIADMMAARSGNMFGGGKEPRVFDDNEVLAVTACEIVAEGKFGQIIDLTTLVKDGKIVWDVPGGMWRIFTTFKTRNGGGSEDYMNIIDTRSVRVLLDEVYEPHYARYKDDFGKTFVGFFSDEPLLGNTTGFTMDERIGHKKMPLPWNADVPALLEKSLGTDWVQLMPLLWKAGADDALTARVRYAYMDAITSLVRDNFSNQLGKWCEERGVEYIGHLIEDSNQHARLGCSLGHFFRGLDGQHFAGIDDIGGQVLPGGQHHPREGGFSVGDGEFYHFALGKLASSHAAIDVKKQGRAMCEIFGAYGWSLGVRGMKYLTDHFLVRGVNRFVPHAFSPKAFPDPDCPPHFYAHGENPQIKHFGELMRYTNRVCHLIDGGKHVAPVAILYHAEAEWAGNYMLMQKPARKLHENQIDFDFIPSDIFAEGKFALDKKLKINKNEYRAFVVPYAQFVTVAVADFCSKASANGFPVYIIDALPEGLMDSAAALPANLGKVVSLSALTDELRGAGIFDVTASPNFIDLRYYRYENIYMFSNESICDTFSGTVTVSSSGNCYIYDAWENVCRPIESDAAGGKTELRITLEPYQSALVVFGEEPEELKPAATAEGSVVPLDENWQVSLCEAPKYPEFGESFKMKTLDSIGMDYPDFSGFVRYEKSFDLAEINAAVLELDNAYEGVEVWCNGEYVGLRIAPPFVFDLSAFAVNGQNSLCIEVATTLDRKVRAMMGGSPMMSMRSSSATEPTGLVAGARIYVK